MHPVLFTVRVPLAGLVEVSTYRGAYTLAALTALLVAWRLAVMLGMPSKRALGTLALTALGLPVGARLWHLATNRSDYVEDVSRIWTLEPTGHALFGGIALAALVGFIGSRRMGLDPWRLGDAAAPGLALGLAIMRVGCFCNGCCFGHPTDGPTGVTFPPGSPAHLWEMAEWGLGLFDAPLPIHPTQLYELGGSLVLGVLALALLRSPIPAGVPFLAFITGFAVLRWANWLVRVPPPTLENPEIYGPIYATVIGVCAVLIVLRISRARERAMP